MSTADQLWSNCVTFWEVLLCHLQAWFSVLAQEGQTPEGLALLVKGILQFYTIFCKYDQDASYYFHLYNNLIYAVNILWGTETNKSKLKNLTN